MHRNADIKTVTRSRAFNHDGGAVVTSTAAAKVKRCWWCLLVHQETAALMRAAQLTGILSKSQYTVECNIHVQKKRYKHDFPLTVEMKICCIIYFFFPYRAALLLTVSNASNWKNLDTIWRFPLGRHVWPWHWWWVDLREHRLQWQEIKSKLYCRIHIHTQYNR